MQFFPALSRSELVRTVCEQMGWHTPDGIPRWGFGLRVLRELARHGIVRLLAKRSPGRGPQKPLLFDRRTAPQPAVREPLAELALVRLEPATEPEDKALWNQWVDRYHPLGYRQPLGAHLRYWVRDGRGRLLDCLLFDRATRRLPCRERFIGWDPATRQRNLPLVVNPRQATSSCPGSASRGWPPTCSPASPANWMRRYRIRPVLLETFCAPPASKALATARRTGSISARPRVAASSMPATSTASPSRTSSSNPFTRTGKSFAIDSSPALHPGPLERLRVKWRVDSSVNLGKCSVFNNLCKISRIWETG